MSKPGYEFDRFYAEVEKRPDGSVKTRILHETAFGKAFQVGVWYANEHACRLKANGFNNNYGTDYDAVSDMFFDPTKQLNWMREQARQEDIARAEQTRKELQAQEDEHKSIVKAHMKARTNKAPGHAETSAINQATDMLISVDRNKESETASSMAYDQWGAFGDSSTKNENGPRYTVNIARHRKVDPKGNVMFLADNDGIKHMLLDVDEKGKIKGVSLTDDEDKFGNINQNTPE